MPACGVNGPFHFGAEAVSIACRASLAERAGLQTVCLQILLDLRLHAGRQHRAGGGSLADELSARASLHVPHFGGWPHVYHGHLFVGDSPSDESSLRRIQSIQ